MSNNGIVNIHGKEYMTVAKRVELAHKDGVDAIETEVLQHSPVVVLRAKVTVKGKSYTGVSSANPSKAIEKSNPYEVAETSAVGRALGFAGYGIIEGIASADEMYKAETVDQGKTTVSDEQYLNESFERQNHPAQQEAAAYPQDRKVCSAHDEPVTMFKGVSKSKFDKDGNPKTYWWHKGPEGQMCFGSGYQD